METGIGHRRNTTSLDVLPGRIHIFERRWRHHACFFEGISHIPGSVSTPEEKMHTIPSAFSFVELGLILIYLIDKLL